MSEDFMNEDQNYRKYILHICFISCFFLIIVWFMLFPPKFTPSSSELHMIDDRLHELIERTGNQQTVHISTTVKYMTFTEQIKPESIPPLLLTKSEPQFNIYINGDDNLVVPTNDDWLFLKTGDKLYAKIADEAWQLSSIDLDTPLNPFEHILAFPDEQSLIDRYQYNGCTYYIADLLLFDSKSSVFYVFKVGSTDLQIVEFSILIYDEPENNMEIIQHKFSDWSQSYIKETINQQIQTIPKELLH